MINMVKRIFLEAELQLVFEWEKFLSQESLTNVESFATVIFLKCRPSERFYISVEEPLAEGEKKIDLVVLPPRD